MQGAWVSTAAGAAAKVTAVVVVKLCRHGCAGVVAYGLHG